VEEAMSTVLILLIALNASSGGLGGGSGWDADEENSGADFPI
jgi:hypothetical protein